MSAHELWIESYQGEVLGEALFGSLARREKDPVHRRQLEVLQLLERSTKELAESVLERIGPERGDTAGTLASAQAMADAVAQMTWVEFLGSFDPVISEFLAKYRRLVELASDDHERQAAEAFVAHEQALETFVRRALGEQEGEPLEAIFALPHVAAAASA